MKNIRMIIKACLYKEGAVSLFVAGVILYFSACMIAIYGSKENSLFVFGLGMFSISAILIVMMTSAIRTLETRKVLALMPNMRASILMAALFVCVFLSLIFSSYFVLSGFGVFKTFIAVLPLLFVTYSLMLICGLLLAKYMTPAITFGLVLIVVPLCVFFASTSSHPLLITIIFSIFIAALWPLFCLYWLNKKQEMLVDNGQGWALRLANSFSRLMLFPQHSSLVGTVLLNGGDSARSMAKRSSIVLLISSLCLLLPYLSSLKENSFDASKILYLFFAVQFCFIEFIRGKKIGKSIWLLDGGVRMDFFRSRAALHMKTAAIHYGLFVGMLFFVCAVTPIPYISESTSILIVIAYYLIMHLIHLSIPGINIPLFVNIYMPISFGENIVNLNANGELQFADNLFAIFLVFGFQPFFILVSALSRKELKKYDFTKQTIMGGLFSASAR